MLNPIDAYARRIVDGELPAGTYHRLACQRHLDDLRRVGSLEFPYLFDFKKADRFFKFAAKLKHFEGEWLGKPVLFEPWQQFVLGSILAWTHCDTGLRRFRTSFTCVPRKNGKSTMAATFALYLAFFDDPPEPANQAFVAATMREQAKIVWGVAQRMVRISGLAHARRGAARIGVRVASLYMDATASKLVPLGADADNLDGLSPGCVILDELHAMKDQRMVDVLETAMGARRQPHMMMITTAGNSIVSVCGNRYVYATQILDGTVEDENTFCFMAHADEADDWATQATARKANPNYGVSVKPDDMDALVRKAKAVPSDAATYKQKRLNIWVNTATPWLSMEGWRKGQTTWTVSPSSTTSTLAVSPESRTWYPDDLRHESCYVGVDLASKLDLCAMAFVFPPTSTRTAWKVLRWVWTPEDTLADRAHRDRAPYTVWAEQGILLTTPGTRVDHNVIRETLEAQRHVYSIERIGFDPWHADKLLTDLVAEDGWNQEQVLEVAQTYRGMSAAALELEAAVLAGQLDTGGCPLMAWAASNVVVQKDGKDNIYPVKKKSRGRIDPIVATIIAMVLAKQFGEADTGRSLYDEGPIQAIYAEAP